MGRVLLVGVLGVVDEDVDPVHEGKPEIQSTDPGKPPSARAGSWSGT